jgi:MtaA/CmuA family methyltransferase
MTPIERVRNTIAGRPVDHLAAQPLVAAFAARHSRIPYIDYTRDHRKLADAQLRVAGDFNLDCLVVRSDMAREVIDIAGEDCIDWKEDKGPQVNPDRAALLLPTKLREFRVPDPFGGGRMHDRCRSIEILRYRAGPEHSVVGWIAGPFTLAVGLRGLERLRTDMQRDPSFASDLLDFTAEVAVRFCDAQIRSGADTMGIGDSAAAGISADLYERLLLPRHKRIVEAIKHRHPHVLMRLHMCGQIEPLLSKIGQLQIDIVDVDSVVDLAKARAWLGQGRVIVGNVSPTHDLRDSTPRRVYDAAKKCHKACGVYHIVGAGCEVHADTPPDNLRALVRYAQEHLPEGSVANRA